MVFLEPERIATPIGLSHPLDVRRVLPAEEILKEYRAAVTARDGAAVARSVLTLLSHFGLSAEYAVDALLAFALLYSAVNRLMQVLPPAVLGVGNLSSDARPPPYDYPQRSAYTWIDMIASTYHWSREAILSLHPVEAARYVQEIKVREVEEKEWRYSLSELAYDHKTGRYKPMRKPAWMTAKLAEVMAQAAQGGRPPEPAKIKIPRKFLDNSGPVVRIEDLVAKD